MHRESEPQPIALWLQNIVGNMPPPSADMDCAPTQSEASEAKLERVRNMEASIPAEWRWATLEAPDLPGRVQPPSAVEAARRAVAAPRIAILGPSGAGKTSLAVALLRARSSRQSGAAKFFHAFELGLARSRHRLGDGEAALVEDAMTIPIALLDSVGQDDSPRGIEAVRDVVLKRFADSKATIVTIDLSMDQVTSKFGDGFARRVLERATVIRLGVGAK